jgi:hypothetical protein
LEGAYHWAAERNESLRAIRRLGLRLWKRWSGYHRRSLAETAMSRLKRLGERLSARDPARQVAEVQIRCAILNTFNAIPRWTGRHNFLRNKGLCRPRAQSFTQQILREILRDLWV